MKMKKQLMSLIYYHRDLNVSELGNSRIGPNCGRRKEGDCILNTKKVKTQSDTERLVIRPLQNQDYEAWLEGCRNRFPSQYKYDDDKMDLNGWSQKKFNEDVVAKFQGFADRDEIYVFGIFRKSDQKHIGKVEICTLIRDEFQWGLLGYTIHNQYWRKGYGK